MHLCAVETRLGRGWRGGNLATLMGALVLLSWTAPPGAAQEAAPPAVLREVGFDQRLDEQVPLDLEFRDDVGQPVQLRHYFGGKPVILALVYYDCPMLCTLTLNGLVSALKILSFDVGDQFDVVTVSFDPRESPALAAAKKKTYLERYGRPGAERGWHFLTGDQGAIERLTRAVGFRYVWDAEQEQYAHATGITVLTPAGKIARYFFGVEFAPRDLRLGLVEASHDRIGSPVDQLLLYCYHYDPATGKYGAVAMSFIRLGGALTVLILGTFIVVMLRRERRASNAPVPAAVAHASRVTNHQSPIASHQSPVTRP